MSDPRRRSPLSHRREISAREDARLIEHPFLGKLVLRGEREMLSGPLGEVLGTPGPDANVTSSSIDGHSVLWIGPDERWLIVPADMQGDVQGRLAGKLGGQHHQIVDVSDYYVAIGLSGGRARDMLSKVTVLDVHPREFGAGAVAGTVFGRAQAVLWRPGEGSGLVSEYVIFVRRSMADYLWCLLAQAGREYGLPEEAPLTGEAWRLAR